MTSGELPPQAVSIKRAVSEGTCTTATAEALEQIHHNNQDRRPALATRIAGTRRPQTQTANVGASKARGKKPRKQAPIAVLEDHEDSPPVLSSWEKFKLATFVVNNTLKVLTSIAQSSSRSPTKLDKPLSNHASAQTCAGDPGVDLQEPLRSLSVNQIRSSAGERCSEARSWPTTPEGNASSLLATAKCGSVAFAILRSIDAQKLPEAQVSDLQLEQGMSVFIGKLITFGLYEMAVEELQILRRRLETPEALSTLGDMSTRLASKSSIKIPFGSTKKSLPDLLVFHSTKAKGQLLDLIITFQFQVLKVISARRNPIAVEAAIGYLEGSSSPINFVERQIDQRYPQTSVKAVQQLESLSRLIFQFCNGLRSGEQHLISNKSICPSVELQYYVLATKIRLKWWKIAKHQGDALKEIVRPFEKCLASFQQRSSLTAKEKYSLSQEQGERLLTYLHSLRDSPVCNVEQALSEIQLMLANGAQESSQFKDADRWLNESHQTLLLLSPTSQICILMCRQASLYVRLQARRGSKQRMLSEMTDLCTLLEHDMGANPKEISEIMTDLNAFRKTLLAMVRAHHKMPISAEDESLDFLVWSSKVLCSAIKFISNVTGKLQKQKEGETQKEPQLSMSNLIWQIIDPFIESLAMLAKMTMACSSKHWDSIEAGLQCSIALFRSSVTAVNYKEFVPNVRSSTTSCIVSISNAYWCRFLNQKKTSAKYSELQGLLAASIEAVSDQPTSVQDAALLSVKFEKQASLYESSNEYFKAAEAHANIMKTLIANGSVSAAAEAAATDSLNVVFKKTAIFGVISRTLRSYITAVTSEAAEALSPQWILDFKELSAVERGLILEHQLAAHNSIMSSRGYSVKGLQFINQLASTLLSIYTAKEYPIRRLRVCLKLVQLNYGQSLEFNQGIQEQLSWNPTSNEQGSSGLDVGLQQYYNHLCTRRNLYTELCSKIPNPKCPEHLLDAWYDLLQESHDWPALELCVDDITDWMLQLRALVHILDLEGLEFQRVSVLQLLVKLYEMADPIRLANLIPTLTALGVQIARLGYSGSAGLIFHQAQSYMSTTTVSTPDTIGWHLAYAEYLVSIGNHDKSGSHMAIARDLFHDYDHKRLQGNQAIELFSTAASVYAQLSAARGDSSKALFFCRLRVKLLHRLWSGPEDRVSRSTNHEAKLSVDIENIAESMTALSICNRSRPLASTRGGTQLNESDKHSLIPQLFNALTNLAEVYAHEGLLPESQYYMEQSAKISSNASSTAFQTRYHAQLGHYLIRGESIENGIFHLNKAEATLTPDEPNRHLVILQLARAEKYVKLGELTLAMSSLEFADSTLEKMMQIKSMDRLRSKQIKVALLEAPPPTNSGIRSKSKVLANKGAACTTVASETSSARPRANELSALRYTRARLLRRQASIALKEGDFDRADSLLRRAAQNILTSFDLIAHTSLTAKSALGRALANMASDLVFCVIPESTTCYPSIRPISGHQDIRDEIKEKPANQSAPAKSKSCKMSTKAVKPPGAAVLPSFIELLNRSQEDLNKVRCLAVSAGSTMHLHSLMDGLMRVLMMLSAFPHSKALCMQTPLFAMYSMEIGRTIAMARQHLALGIERQISQTRIAAEWPANDHYNLALSGAPIPNDLACFQSQYLDIIPKSWMVLSLTLSESRDEIRITKFRSSHGPFILNLPLDRHSQDRGEETFGFEQGKAELRDIITLANYSTQDAPDPSRKGAKTAWWEARAALDVRLKDLLVNIESIWFGGFRGIFDNNVGSPDLLSRFQQSLNKILDKYLPSRQKQTKVKKYDRVILDSHVLELFVALGNPNERELDEDLLDLLYFAIDILQFHGEHNAYDEVDFDAMTIELVDALRQYHEAASKQDEEASQHHTILILDKAMHCFPWESLPCLMGQAVSRLPSLGCLRDRILQYTEQQQHLVENTSPSDPMLTINRSNGAYVLNPSGDLTATQSRFEAPLSTLPDWHGIRNRAPSEGEMKAALETKDVFLYFGHGSGSQYIRSRTVQKLDKCAVALLMGCSSGAMTEAGEFQSYGTPINYMHAGCPAVLATLWDVTDKDIDRFSLAALGKWGLLEEEEPISISSSSGACSASPVKKGAKSSSRGSKSKVRKEVKSSVKKNEQRGRSLDRAVAESRDACIMRYLNGAAPVIYGVPVMLSSS